MFIIVNQAVIFSVNSRCLIFQSQGIRIIGQSELHIIDAGVLIDCYADGDLISGLDR